MKIRSAKQFFGTMLMIALLSLLSSIPAFSCGWTRGISRNAWWFDLGNGNFHKSTWQWLDGNRDGIAESYCFDANGWMYSNTTTPDGYTVNENGAWTEQGIVQKRFVAVAAGSQRGAELSDSQSATAGRIRTSQADYLRNKESSRNEVLERINLFRQQKGLPRLKQNEHLQALAQIRAGEISASYTHARPGTGKPLGWRDGVNGEMIMRMVDTPSAAVAAWESSGEHTRLMSQSSYQTVGTGYYVNEAGEESWVVLFAN